MNVPEGYTEDEILTIMAGIQRTLAKKKFPFGYYDEEDIAQHMWRLALELLESEKFEASKGPLGALLYSHIKNRLSNLRRDKYWRPSKNQKQQQAKRNIMSPAHLSPRLNLPNKTKADLSFLNEMPLHLQNDFYREAHGLKVTPSRKANYREWVEATRK